MLSSIDVPLIHMQSQQTETQAQSAHNTMNAKAKLALRRECASCRSTKLLLLQFLTFALSTATVVSASFAPKPSSNMLPTNRTHWRI
jgi:hypothetical protein